MESIYQEEERTRPELLRRGFEFYQYRELPANYPATDAHIHDAVEFIYVTQGSVRVKLDEREAHLTAGEMVMFRSRGIHSMWTEELPKNRYYILKISPKLIQRVCPKNLAPWIGFRLSVQNNDLKFVWRREEMEGRDLQASLDRLIENERCEDSFVDVSMLGSVLQFLYGVLKSTEEEPTEKEPSIDLIYESILYINERFSEDVTAEEVAAKLNVSYSYFARAFKRATGRTFKDYLNVTRTNEAELLLRNTVLSVTEIAMQCGYNNISYFTATYKRYKGKTPLAERKSNR